jgi:hypothetical protein
MGAAAAKDAAPEVFAAAATHRPIDAPVVVAVEDAASSIEEEDSEHMSKP